MTFLSPPSLAFLDGFGGTEMVVIFFVVLILFGGKKMPEFARGLGKTLREFKKAASGVEEEFRRAMDEKEREERILPPAAAATAKPPLVTLTPAENIQPHSSSGSLATTPKPGDPPPAPPKMMPRDADFSREDDGHFS